MQVIISGLVWDSWNIEHISKHGIKPRNVEQLLANRELRPIFQKSRKGTIACWGKDGQDRYLLVILAERKLGFYYTVTARPMTRKERNCFMSRRR